VGSIPNDIYGANPVQTSAEAFAGELTSGRNGKPKWTESYEHANANVTASDFGLGNYNGNNAVFYAGHGDFGLVDLAYMNQTGPLSSQYFGPGALRGNLPENAGIDQNIGTISGPQWLFFASSDTVTPPGNLVPNDAPDFDSNWAPAFRTVPGRPTGLHGIYGSWQGPGPCGDPYVQTVPGRTCDISAPQVKQVGQQLAQYLWTNVQPIVIHDAWLDAEVDAGLQVGPTTFEDMNNVADTFTGQPGINNSPGGNSYNFTCLCASSTASKSQVTVKPDTFVLQPMTLNSEPINEATQQNRAQSYLGEPVTNQGDGLKTTLTTASGLYGAHIYNSGAVVLNARSQSNPMAFSAAQAE